MNKEELISAVKEKLDTVNTAKEVKIKSIVTDKVAEVLKVSKQEAKRITQAVLESEKELTNEKGLSKQESTEIVDVVLDTVIEGAVADRCTIPGLGTLIKTKTAARSGINRMQSEGKAWTKPEGYTIKLKLSTKGKTLV